MLSDREEDRVVAKRQLDAAKAAAANDWERRVVSAITDDTSADTLLAGQTSEPRRLEALYALGSRALVGGRSAEAQRWFQVCVDAQAVDTPEYDLAVLHLRSLAGAGD